MAVSERIQASEQGALTNWRALTDWRALTNWRTLTSQDRERIVKTDKGDVPIQKEYFQLWKTQRASYMEYVYYAYVTTICFRKYVVTSRCPPCI